MSNDLIDTLQTFVNALTYVYVFLILAAILLSWFQLPYNRTLASVRTFLDDTTTPYLRLFRHFVPAVGPLDLSPMIGILCLYLANAIVQSVLDSLRPS